MGNTQKAAETAKNRRYSRSSNFAHWMDNIRDKKTLKIDLKQTAEGTGKFTLVYSDLSADDYLSTNCVFTYTGTYRVLGPEEERDVFGVSINVTARGNVVLDEAGAGTPGASGKHTSAVSKRAVSMKPFDAPASPPIDLASTASTASTVATKSTVRTTMFLTEKMACKLSEGKAVQYWTVTPSTDPDCLEKATSERERRISWVWTAQDGLKVAHTAPPGALDFLGEETFESTGSSSIDLKLRIPQLHCIEVASVLSLNEVGGWKLGKKGYS